MSHLNGRLNTTEETLTLLHSDTNTTDVDLDTLTDEVIQLEVSVEQLRQQVYDAKNANIEGERPDCVYRLSLKQAYHQHIASHSICVSCLSF